MECLANGCVIRLANYSDVFIGDRPQAPLEAFIPTKADEEEARERNAEPELSVWDTERTTLVQAKSFASPEKIYIGFTLKVELIVLLRANQHLPHLRVVRSPRQDAIPGANGHCGILGLKRPPSVSKNDFKNLRSQLADLCKIHFEEHPEIKEKFLEETTH